MTLGVVAGVNVEDADSDVVRFLPFKTEPILLSLQAGQMLLLLLLLLLVF